ERGRLGGVSLHGWSTRSGNVQNTLCLWCSNCCSDVARSSNSAAMDSYAISTQGLSIWKIFG
ncbi:hypothetical protein FQA47_004391, partial [Oryzias melastigma]